MKTLTFGVNDHALKHFEKGSPFSEFDGTADKLLSLVEFSFGNGTESTDGDGNGTGIFSVPVKGKFLCPTVKLEKGAELVSEFGLRRKAEEGEERNIHTTIAASEGLSKTPVGEATIILYSREALGDSATTDCDFELVTILASVENEPMNPVTMARNMLGKPGGTQVEYTAEQFAEAVWFWSQHSKVSS
jgi:hypothetical protein